MNDDAEMRRARELVEQVRVLRAKMGEVLETGDIAALDECERLLRRAIDRAAEANASFETRHRKHPLTQQSAESLDRMREIVDELRSHYA